MEIFRDSVMTGPGELASGGPRPEIFDLLRQIAVGHTITEEVHSALEAFDEGRFDRAGYLFRRAIEIDNLSQCGFLGTSICYFLAGDYRLAAAYGRQAYVLDAELGGNVHSALYEEYLSLIAATEATPPEPKPEPEPEPEPGDSDQSYAFFDDLPDPAPGQDWDYWPLDGVPRYGPRTDRLKHQTPGLRNCHGYRCDPFEARRELNVVSLGCSWTEGYGVGGSEAWPSRLCSALADRHHTSVANWNLGKSGKSNDYIARMALTAVPQLAPDFMFVLFTVVERREYLTGEGKCLNFSRHAFESLEIDVAADAARDSGFISGFRELINPWDCLDNFLRNYHQISHAMRSFGIPWGFSFLGISPGLQEYMEALLATGRIERDRYLGVPLQCSDFAGGAHPGIESHDAFANLIADWSEVRYPGLYGGRPNSGWWKKMAKKALHRRTGKSKKHFDRLSGKNAPIRGQSPDTIYPLY